MLVSLAIRDIVLIDHAALDWSGGFTALTGETGAGKSVLLDALSLATGQRGDVGLVRQGCAQGEVSACFEIASSHCVQTTLIEAGLTESPVTDIILRRIQNKDGRSRAFCNDKPISVALLRQIGSQLVEIHGQHESQALTDAGTQRDLLDAFGALAGDVKKTGAAYQQWQAAQAALAQAQADLADTTADKDYLTHALAELADLAPEVGEEIKLAQTRELLMNAEKITAELNEISQHLSDEGGGDNAISAALRRLEQVASKAGTALDGVITAIDKMLIETQEARAVLNEAAATIIHDPDRLQKVEQRLFALRDMARKHNTNCDDLASLMGELQSRLAGIEGDTRNITALEAAQNKAEAAYAKTAQALSKARHKAAITLDKRVAAELPPLKLNGGKFHTQIDSVAPEAGGIYGLDKVQFEAATNKGVTPAPIAKIASGGELARFMLALKVVVLEGAQHSTLIFDEVDAGVGGAVAEAVGVRLHNLASNNAQVLVVTHAPQVAARADQHYLVSKTSSQTAFSLLPDNERLQEIARMLSGASITAEAVAAAKRLLEAKVGS